MDDPRMAAADLMAAWLRRQVSAEAGRWLDEARAAAADDRALFLAVGQAARRVGKIPLALGPEDLATAEALRPGWDPRDWSTDQAARLALLLAAPGDGPVFRRRLDVLCAAADVGEAIAWYRGLPLYPEPALHAARAAEGIRSNMRSVFEAVAHRNPYPAEHLDDGAWNQMVLKALFIGSPLEPIQGLYRRANPALALMLRDYAQERRAAGRPVSPEMSALS